MYTYQLIFFLTRNLSHSPSIVSTSLSSDSTYFVFFFFRYADECEVCKVVSVEFVTLLEESSGSHGVLETGYSIEKKKKKTKYVESELRLVETMEGLCDRFLVRE